MSSAAIDTNADGAGEYGGFGELTGVRPLRISMGGVAAAGAVGVDELEPPVLSQVFGDVDANAVVVHKGYVFKIYLPRAGVAPQGMPEEAGGGFVAGPFPDALNSQFLWCAYAWPVQVEVSGVRCFFTNQEGEILGTANRGGGGTPLYEGTAPAGHPAYSAAYVNPDMAGDLAMNVLGQDGNLWATIRW
jgi:hypothetical protein